MSNEYHIALHIKTPEGFETCGEFFLGTSSVIATRLFNSLKGNITQVEEGILIMELRTIYRGLPLDIQMLSCTLEELGDNCKIITKFLFTRQLGEPPLNQ